MANAPTGTVTLVFTDIQGSSAIWEALGDGFRTVLSLHDQILRAAIDEFDGYEVQTAGDAFMLAFADADHALRYCLAVQRRLYDADWPEALLTAPEIAAHACDDPARGWRGIRVRMGVHTGQPWVRPDPTTGRMDYGGPMCNRAARVGGLAYGGQVLASNATWEAAREGLAGDPTIAVEDLGEHRLKGLEQPEQLHQLVPATLAQRRFSPLRSEQVRKTNLVAALDPFIGREEILQEIVTQLIDGPTRLLTLGGGGGAGKSRLARHVGYVHHAKLSGGVWLCGLSEARSVETMLDVIARALGVPLMQEDPAQQLANALRARGPILLILDTFEHLVEVAAHVVEQWLQRAPQARFLVTSRRRLAIAGEHLLRLDPLSDDEAARLFETRARAVKPAFTLSDHNRATVLEIVRRLDHMPLAIELAAARIRMLPPDRLLKRLNQRFRLLRDARGDDRQSTLRGAIDWSWALLKPWEQLALAQCAVFGGGFTLEMAEAILDFEHWDDACWPFEAIASLLDHSLLRVHETVPGHERFHMTHSVFDYAAERLVEDGAVRGPDGQSLTGSAARDRLDDALAEHLATLGAQDTLDALETSGGVERRRLLKFDKSLLTRGVDAALRAGNPVAAAGCAMAALTIYELEGPLTEGTELAQRVLDHGDALSPLDLARLMRRQASLLHTAGRPAEATTLAEQALTAARAAGSDAALAATLATLGRLYIEQGQPTQALEPLMSALELAQRSGARGVEAQALGSIGQVRRAQGQTEEAKRHHERALAIYRDLGQERAAAKALHDLARLHNELGDASHAMALCQESLMIARRWGDRLREADFLASLGLFYQTQGLMDDAQRVYHEALEIRRDVGNRRIEGMVLGNLGILYGEMGDLDASQTHMEAALEIAQEVGHRIAEGLSQGNLGELHLLRGDPAKAEEYLRGAIVICDDCLTLGAGAFRGMLAVVRAEAGDFDEARALLDHGERQVRGAHVLQLGKLLVRRGEIEVMARQPAKARDALERAEAVVAQLGERPDPALVKMIEGLRAMIDAS